jgi:hypothetical protein
MARLTWEQVQAPNFNGVLDGLVASSRLINNAFGQAREGIDDLRKTQTNNADNAIMSELLKYQGNPDALMADLSSGQFQGRHDMSKISSTMREHLAKAPADLLKFASEKSAFDQGQKSIADRDFFRANNGLVNQYLDLERLGTAEQRAEFKKANPDFFAKANFGLLSELSKTGQFSQSTDTRNRQDLFRLGEDSTKFGWETDDRQAEQAASTLYQEALAQGGGERWLNQNKGALIEKFGDQAFNRAITRFQGGGGTGSFGSFSGGAPGLGGAGAPGPGTGIGGKNLYDVVLGDQPNGGNAYGFTPPKPVSQMSMGELYDYQRSVMVPATAAKGVGGGQGSSAAGAYQIVSKTLADAAPKVFGADWRTMQFTPENQDKLGEYLFNQADKTQLHKVWEGLPAADYRGKSWAEMRSIITQNESGGVADPRRAQVAMNTSIQQSLSGDQGVRVAQRFSEGWNDSSNITQVSKRLTGKGGTFEGENADYVAEQIRQVRDKFGVNDAVAGAILAESREGSESGLSSFFDGWANPFSDGLKANINWDKAEEMAALAKDRTGLARTMVGISDKTTAMAGMQQANAQVAQIESAYRNEQLAAAATGRRVDHAYWQGLLSAAKGAQTGAFTGAVPSAMDGAPRPPAPVQRAHTPVTRAVQPTQSPVVAQARGIMRLGGKIREKQAQSFQARYGVTPEEAINNPGAVEQRNSSATVQLAEAPSRGQLIIDANAALLQGAAAIAAFKQRYGQHPRVFAGM